MYQECKSNGATIQRELTDNPRAREFHVTDSDGNVIRFGGAPEGQEHQTSFGSGGDG